MQELEVDAALHKIQADSVIYLSSSGMVSFQKWSVNSLEQAWTIIINDCIWTQCEKVIQQPSITSEAGTVPAGVARGVGTKRLNNNSTRILQRPENEKNECLGNCCTRFRQVQCETKIKSWQLILKN